jgi:prophage DNA circulation protein
MAWTDDFVLASADLSSALLGAATDPADAIRLLLPLCGWIPPRFPGTGSLAATINAAQDAMASNLRCTACVALATASASYNPVSYQDALATRATVCGVLGDEAQRAADAGLDATYQALRTLRAAVALDLATRGANLAFLVEVETQVPMPSLAEAWTLYQDTSREPSIVASADPPHPLFLPLEFPALSK